jgi:GalNAc-alpha-(1->4)-GalNAc-alpha-(1->3)-diNAcBac-PP-undecaprenol alpha-1,4-N-acetyl-D-galactosaminyltransferase
MGDPLLQVGDAEKSALKFEMPNLVPNVAPGGQPKAPAPVVTTRKRLAFVIAHLGPGGAQRVAVNAANTLVERGIDIHVILVGENKNVYRLDPRITLHAAGADSSADVASEAEAIETERSSNLNTQGDKHRGSAGVIDLARKLLPHGTFRGAISRYVLTPAFFAAGLSRRTFWLRGKIKSIEADAVLSFLTQTNILTVLATRGLKTRTVISERNDPRLQRHRRRVELLRKFLYRHADVVTANSRGALTALEAFVPKEKLAFLPNPLALPASIEVARLESRTIITVGRLVEQKGLDVLLAAWAKASPILPGWRLAIVGDGPLRGELEVLAGALGVGDSVDWHGHLSDPFPLVRASKFFVLTSRFEGTPNALLEAMACGLPGIVSDASPGPCELVGEDESAGLIVPVEDSGATAEAIVKLASDEPLRQRLSAGALDHAREYEADRALDVWLKLLRCE